MKSLPKPDQLIHPHDFPLIDGLETPLPQTLPSFPLKSQPERSAKLTPTDSVPEQTSSKGLKLKFNICSDQLQCFMAKPKAEKFRSLSLRLTKQSRSEAALQSFKLDLKQFKSKLEEPAKSQTQRHHVEQNPFSEIQDNDDLSTILSNEIIYWIEQKGIRYNWSDVEPVKGDGMGNENKEDQEEIEELFNMFSDVKYAKKSVRQNFSTNQSFVTETSVIEGEDNFIMNETSGNNFSGYEPMSYNQHYEGVGEQSFDKNYSLASTMEPYSAIYYPMQMYHLPESHTYNMNGLKSLPSILFPSGEFVIRPQGLGKDPRTTLMIKNIPNKYTIQYLSQEIDRDFSNFYDFLYLPCDTKSGANQGYGFINFTDLQAITRFYQMFHGKKWRRFKSEKICNLTYARLQGRDSLIEHFQNSKVLNHKEKKYQPIIKRLNQQINDLIKEQQIAHNSTNQKQ